ncbi:MAG: hypothetical protein HQK92_09685 [Nitrospirae bacterium]|nr:hypothetical protein [Nitrospirota bacterium]
MIKINAALFIFILQCLVMAVGFSVFLLLKLKKYSLKNKEISASIKELDDILKQRIEAVKHRISELNFKPLTNDPEDELIKDIELARLNLLTDLQIGIKKYASPVLKGDFFTNNNNLLINHFDNIIDKFLISEVLKVKKEKEAFQQEFTDKAKRFEAENNKLLNQLKSSEIQLATENQKNNETISNLRKRIAELLAYKEVFDDLYKRFAHIMKINESLKKQVEKYRVQTDEGKLLLTDLDKINTQIKHSMEFIANERRRFAQILSAENATEMPSNHQVIITVETSEDERTRLKNIIKTLNKEKNIAIRKYEIVVSESESEKITLRNTIEAMKRRMTEIYAFRGAVEDTFEKLKIILETNAHLKKILEKKNLKTEELEEMFDIMSTNNKHLEISLDVLRRENKKLKSVIENFELDKDWLKVNGEAKQFYSKLEEDYKRLQKEYFNVVVELRKYEITS